jgi:hypothetical protein
MKLGLKVAMVALVLVLVPLAFFFQQRELQRSRALNRTLQSRVDDLLAQQERALAVAEQAATSLVSASTAPREDVSRELMQLRGEAARLRLQDRQAEELRQEQMRAAQAKLKAAEVDAARLATLHAEGVVSSAELSKARFTVEILQAEARGDVAEATKVRLRQAEDELARAAELRKESLISEADYQQAVRKVNALRGGN